MSRATLTVLIPILDDWDALAELIPEIDSVAAGIDASVRVVVIDDASESTPKPLDRCARLERVDVLRLRKNVGHQQAIAVGLAYCNEHLAEAPILVMDGDGEDDPSDIPRLWLALEAAGHHKVVFAERTRRSESMQFRFFYLLYRIAHWLLSGRRIRFGNFSVIPAARVKQLVVASELSAHYAAAVVKSRIPYETIQTKRMPRISGASTMNFVSLVTHGFNALSVFSEEVITRVVVAGGAIMTACTLGAVAVAGVRLLTDLAVPGWATYVLALLAVIFLQTLAICFVTGFVLLSLKRQAPMLAERNPDLFVERFYPYPGRPGA